MRRSKNAGFTLLELGLVLVLLSLMASGILTITTQNMRVAKKNELEMKFNVIETAILAFRKANGYIPCPGDITLSDTDTTGNFGFQAINNDPLAPTCQGGTSLAGSPSLNWTYTIGGFGGMVEGSVPVRTLGLNDEYAYDPWGNRFMYVVDTRVTSASTFTPAKFTDTSLIGNIAIRDTTGGNVLASNAVLVLLSMGPNGHGAVQRSGNRKYVGSTDTDEWNNCDCNATSFYPPNGLSGAPANYQYIFITKPATTTFDDVLRYYTRTQLLFTASDAPTEK